MCFLSWMVDILSGLLWRVKLISKLGATHLGNYFVFCNQEMQRRESSFSSALLLLLTGIFLGMFFGIRVPVVPWKAGAVRGWVRSQARFHGAGKLCKGSSVPGCETTFTPQQPQQNFSFFIFAEQKGSASSWFQAAFGKWLVFICGFMLVLTRALLIAVWFQQSNFNLFCWQMCKAQERFSVYVNRSMLFSFIS